LDILATQTEDNTAARKMYPAHFFSLFPPFPREEKVFVAMSFDPRFTPRWENVIAPAIGRIKVNDVRLEPIRVDARKVSDSILTEILDGIRKSRLIFADITTVGKLEGSSEKTPPMRTGNVMYEVGLAHAVRLPEEVLLFRSDDDQLLFDTSNVRVNRYEPDKSPAEARNIIADALESAIKEIDLRKHLEVQKAVETLDCTCWSVLVESQREDGIAHPQMQTPSEALGNNRRVAAIARLLEFGALKTIYSPIAPDGIDAPVAQYFRYKSTEFGDAILRETACRLGMFSPEIQRAIGENSA